MNNCIPDLVVSGLDSMDGNTENNRRRPSMVQVARTLSTRRPSMMQMAEQSMAQMVHSLSGLKKRLSVRQAREFKDFEREMKVMKFIIVCLLVFLVFFVCDNWWEQVLYYFSERKSTDEIWRDLKNNQMKNESKLDLFRCFEQRTRK